MSDAAESLATTALLMTGGGFAATQRLLVDTLIAHATNQANHAAGRNDALRTAAHTLLIAVDQEAI